jgi:cellulose synthase/poly-beta-1,6-N-acetylglucosamine synthase-like glycosyltransferase
MALLVWLLQPAVAAVTAVYLAAVLFRLIMVYCGSIAPPRSGTLAGPDERPDEQLPLYTVLVPLVSPDLTEGQSSRLIAELSAVDYPASRTEVLLLVGDDGERPPAELPSHIEVVSVGGATKTQAYAMGLAKAHGEFCVGYEPGQHPDPGQLRAASRAFADLPSWVVCLRPELSCANPDASWLTHCAAGELAVNSVLLPRGLDRFRLVLAARGASCHFRTDALRQLAAWDEADELADADLGVRIARRGWAVRMLSSVTAVEAEERLGPWLSQRAAELRHSYRSWLAHGRAPYRLWRDLGPVRAATLQFSTALSACTALANPLPWLLVIAWLVAGSGSLDAVFPPGELSVVVTAMLLGNLCTAYSLMIGCMEQGRFPAIRTLFLAPGYWALLSLAAYRALLPAGRRVSAGVPVPSIAAS